ncbi:SDR family NAD(P)-dependent oxidoreductase [Marinovum sp.]|uniref:SDR family NAD(P)-dependent oxidoreductase n=1 Tax=Marinovum sp. TaxID=2024839 RepID=UPI003A92C280
MYGLTNKSILITGATGFIGRELALGLSAFGAHVIVNSRKERECTSIVENIEERGGIASVACFDVTSESDVRDFVESIDHVDVLVNNAYAGIGGTVLSARSEDYLASYTSSVVASANLLRQLVPKFRVSVKTHGYASVINVASMYGMVSPDHRIYDTPGNTNPPFYGAAKAALIQFTRYAACEFAKDSIRVNSISPGPFPSAKTQAEASEMVERIVSKVPMGRIGCPSELVGPVAFLASDASSYVTGVNLPVDGGWTAW